MVDYKDVDGSVLKQKNLERVTTVEKLDERDWDRDSIKQRANEVQNNHDTIETILQDINEQLDSIPSEEELRDEWSGFLDRITKDSKGRPKQLPRAFFEAERDRYELMLRQAEWNARLKELEMYARKRLSEKFDQLLDEYRTASSYETLEDAIENKAEHFASEKINQKTTRLESKINQVEKLGQAIREERRADRKTIKELASAADGVDQEEIEGIVESAAESGLEQFITSQGVFELDQELRSQDEDEVEREQAAEAAASDAVEEVEEESRVEDEFDVPLKDETGTYLIKDVGFQERVDRLCELWSEEEIPERIDNPDDSITKSEIAEMVDMSQAALFNDGLIDKIAAEEEVFLNTP